MISIIVCTAKEDINSLEQNVRETVGLVHEIIVVRNNGQYSLAQAYNMAAKQAQYEYLCFIHDDILVHTQEWGTRLVTTFRHLSPDAALLGVIGTQYKSVFPSPWTSPDLSKNKGKIWQNDKDGSYKSHLLCYSNDSAPTHVVMVDGMFLFTSKSSLDAIGYFDEALIGFHCYDIDLALAIYFKGKKTFVTNEIEIEHFSKGKLNEAWFLNQIYLFKKWRKFMPANSVSRGKVDWGLEPKSLKRSLYVLFKNKAKVSTKWRYLLCIAQSLCSLAWRRISGT